MADSELAPPPAKGKRPTFKRQRKKSLPKKPYPHRAKRGASLVYDPLAHAEYVTGFRKRKNARRLEAAAKNAETEKEKLKEARRDKREFIRESASRMRGHVGGSSVPGDDDEEEKDNEEKEEYQADDDVDTVFTTTVTKMDTAKDTSFVKSTLAKNSKEKYSRSKPLTKDIAATKKAAAELAASVASSLKGGGGHGRRNRQGIQKNRKGTKGGPARKERKGGKGRKATQ